LGPTINPAFDSRITAFPPTAVVKDPTLPHGNLTKGYMQTASPGITMASIPIGGGTDVPSASTTATAFYTLLFLYNPSEIDESYSLDTNNGVTPAFLRSSADTGTAIVGTGGTLNFSLLFDRTYEVNYGKSGFAHDLGVLVDMHVLKGLTGITMPLSAADQANALVSVAGKGAKGTISSNSVYGTMQMLPIWAVFPLILGGNYGQTQQSTTPAMMMPDISLMRYFGYVTSMSISFTHFNQRMIPFRCGVNLTMQLMSSAGWQ
jgi:hypothetical protein